MKAHDKIDPGKATPPNYFDEFMEYEGRRLQAEDRDIQEDACRDYFRRTSPREWSFDGWLDYWDMHRPASVIASDLFDATLHVDESRYLEIESEERAARHIGEAPEEKTPAAPGRKAAPSLTKKEKAAKIAACRKRLEREHGDVIQEAREHGWLIGWKWQEQKALFQWLIDTNIAKRGRRDPHRVTWNIEDGTFEDRAGNPKTKASLSASKSAKNGGL